MDLMDFLEQLKKPIQERVLEQAQRHVHATGSHADWGRIVDIQIGQEKEKLVKLAGDLEEKGEFQTSQMVHTLIDEWLPNLAKEIRDRR